MPWFLREPGRAHPHLIRRCAPYPCLDTRLPMERDSASFHPRLVTVTSRDSRPRDSQHHRHSRLPYLRDTTGSSRGLCSSCPKWLYRPDDQGPSPFPLNRLASRSGPSPCSLPCTVHSRRAVPRTASRTSLALPCVPCWVLPIELRRVHRTLQLYPRSTNPACGRHMSQVTLWGGGPRRGPPPGERFSCEPLSVPQASHSQLGTLGIYPPACLGSLEPATLLYHTSHTGVS